jgi:hypothetical protein
MELINNLKTGHITVKNPAFQCKFLVIVSFVFVAKVHLKVPKSTKNANQRVNSRRLRSKRSALDQIHRRRYILVETLILALAPKVNCK